MVANPESYNDWDNIYLSIGSTHSAFACCPSHGKNTEKYPCGRIPGRDRRCICSSYRKRAQIIVFKEEMGHAAHVCISIQYFDQALYWQRHESAYIKLCIDRARVSHNAKTRACLGLHNGETTLKLVRVWGYIMERQSSCDRNDNVKAPLALRFGTTGTYKKDAVQIGDCKIWEDLI